MNKVKGGIDYSPRLSNAAEQKKQQSGLSVSKAASSKHVHSNNVNLQSNVSDILANNIRSGVISTSNKESSNYNPYVCLPNRNAGNERNQQITSSLKNQQILQCYPKQTQSNTQPIFSSLQNANNDDNRGTTQQFNEGTMKEGSNNSKQLSKNDQFTSNYRVTNTYRPISNQNFNQNPNDRFYDNNSNKKLTNNIKTKLNKSSKSETPLKHGQKDLQKNQQPNYKDNEVKIITNPNNAQINIQSDSSQSKVGNGQKSKQNEINSSNIMNQQMMNDVKINQVGEAQQKQINQLRYESVGQRYGTAHSEHHNVEQQSERLSSPTEQNEQVIAKTTSNFYPQRNNTQKQVSPYNYTSKDVIVPNIITASSIQSNLIGPKLSVPNPIRYNIDSQQFVAKFTNIPSNQTGVNTQTTGGLGSSRNITVSSQNILSSKQNPQNPKKQSGLEPARKPQTPKRNYQPNNNTSMFTSTSVKQANNQDGEEKRAKSPDNKNLFQDSNLKLQPNENNYLNMQQQNQKQLQQYQNTENALSEQVSTGNDKKNTLNIDQAGSNEGSEMFLIRDQDTGLVYDIRQIDNIDTFQKPNNQEYFDKLKRRHKNAWQGWWNSKKENNIKMIQSVRQNNFSMVEQLLQHERADLIADTDFKDSNQWSCIHYAAFNGNAGILNLLISHDADINQTNNLEQTALMIASEKGFAEIVQICLMAGAEVNKQDLNKNTALHFSCKSNNLECVRMILSKKNVNLTIRNVENKLAVECTSNPQITSLFVEEENSKFKTNFRDGQQQLNNQNIQTDKLPSNHFLEDNKMREFSLKEVKTQIQNQVIISNQNDRYPQNSLPPQGSTNENILSKSALTGFYNQKANIPNKDQEGSKSSSSSLTQHVDGQQKMSFEAGKLYSGSGNSNSGTLSQNRSSNSNNEGRFDCLPKLAHTHSTSSQGSSHSSQNQLNDLSQMGLSNFYGQSNQQQPWTVIIHDFPNESVEKMFQGSFNKDNFNSNTNDLNSQQTCTNGQSQIDYLVQKNANSDLQTSNLDLQKVAPNNINGNNSSNYNNNFNTNGSTNTVISNPSSGQLSPSQKHHKKYSQDILSSSQILMKKASSTQMQQSQTQQNNLPLFISPTSVLHEQQRVGPDQFRIVNQIGRGSFGEVYLVEKKGSSTFYAMKMLHKSKVLGQNLTKYALTERNVLSIMSHPFIVKLIYAFQTSKDLFLIMEYMPGGDLSHALQRDKRFSEQRARIYFVEIMLAIRDLHKHDIIYRDLKPENIVIDSEGHAMLTDFGLSKDGIYDHYSTHSFCGSLAYLAPEMLKRCGHGKAVDYYHLGVLLYEMLTGTPPFFSDSKDEICHNIEYSDIRFPSHVSDNARNLIQRLLVKNPSKRLGYGKNDFEEMKKHPFFNGINWINAFQRKLKPPQPFIKQVVDSKNSSIPNFMMTMTPFGMVSDNHLNGWSFINNLDSKNGNPIIIRNNDNLKNINKF